jgi:hypothetical protein
MAAVPIIEVRPQGPLKRPSKRRRRVVVVKTVKALRSAAAAERAADKAKREADALKWASGLPKAKLDAPKARAYIESECKTQFRIGSYIVRTRIWPAVRVKQRLPERALSGPRLSKK